MWLPHSLAPPPTRFCHAPQQRGSRQGRKERPPITPGEDAPIEQRHEPAIGAAPDEPSEPLLQGERRRRYSELREGIAPTDRVVINGLIRVRVGAKVAAQDGKIDVQ